MESTDIQQRIKKFKAFGESLTGATVYFRSDWDVFYFDLQGKMFGLMNHQAENQAMITLKNLPIVNEELREMYPETILPGYHTNKNHWNSIKLASLDLDDEAIQFLIQRSYQLVYQKLTKKQQADIH
ncbi:MmcQ/YjbR family DNA-binding protein [Enterococcus hailinensis]|uniref:MmcQ/YjbR family DNA-binding protein n=1 Tax=Enterococcus hailinensis TaxID=3238988 RepID=UPI0038B2740F